MEVTSPGRIPVQPTFDTGNVDDEKAIELKEEFTLSISRGGLCKPSDYIFISSAHAFALLRYVIHDNHHILKVKDSTTGKSITDTNITIDGKQYRIRKFIQSGVLRCTKCQGFGHLWKGCNKPEKCVRCSGPNCEVGDCKKTHTTKMC